LLNEYYVSGNKVKKVNKGKGNKVTLFKAIFTIKAFTGYIFRGFFLEKCFKAIVKYQEITGIFVSHS